MGQISQGPFTLTLCDDVVWEIENSFIEADENQLFSNDLQHC